MATDSTSNVLNIPSEQNFTIEGLSEVQKAMHLVSSFENFLIGRARLYSALHHKANRRLPSPSTFEGGSGYFVGLRKWSLNEATLQRSTPVKFFYHDSRDGGPYHEFEVPRDFIFGDDGSEADYQKFLELKARFEG